MRIEIPFKTPSINQLYWHRGNIKIMKTEAKDIKLQIKGIIAEIKPNIDYLAQNKLKVLVEIYEDWYFKNGEIARKDISNREKFLTDAVFDALGLDDKIIFENTYRKIQSDQEKAVITLEVI